MALVDNPTRDLKLARRRAQQILSDLKDIIAETELIRLNEYRFHYAIDSSEVYSYLFPMEDDGILSDIFSDNRIENFAYSDYCLHEIISKRRLNRAITRFHANEIRSLYERHFSDLAAIDGLAGIGELESNAKKELSQFTTNKREQVVHVDEDGTPNIVPDDKLLETMRDLAPNIYVILMEQATSRSQRKSLIGDLLKSHDPISPNVQAHFNKPCYKYFIEVINRLRPGRAHQNMTDAATLEALISYNQVKKDRYEFVRLISRDRSIYRAYNFFVRDGGFEKFYGEPSHIDIHLVRHPRTFIWANERHVLAGENARKIGGIRTSLESFVDDAFDTVEDEYEDDVKWTSWAVTSLNRNFRELNSRILDLINSSLTRDVMNQNVIEAYRSELLTLLKKLYRGKSLDEELRRLSTKITKDLLDAHNDIMFVSASTSSPTSRGDWRTTEAADFVTVRYDLPFFPYDFRFRDKFFRSQLSEASKGLAANGPADEFVGEHGLLLAYIARRSSEPISACERRMAMALQQAVQGDWEGAIYYSKLAVTVPAVQGLNRSEAHYLHSIVIRRNSQDVDKLEDAVRSAKSAVGKGKFEKVNPKFLRESAAAILALLLERYRADGPIVLEDQAKEVEAFRQLEQAMVNYGDDKLGVANCLRIGCSYFIDSRGRRDVDKAVEFYERLKIHIEENDPNFTEMSFRFCDTVLAVYKSRKWRIPFEEDALNRMMQIDLGNISRKDLGLFKSRRFYPEEVKHQFE